jgi:hypothetical protein
MGMGRVPPVGYVPHERTLVIHQAHARIMPAIFGQYLELGRASGLKAEPAAIVKRAGNREGSLQGSVQETCERTGRSHRPGLCPG